MHRPRHITNSCITCKYAFIIYFSKIIQSICPFFSSVFLVLGHHSGTTIQKVFKIVLDENAEKHRNSVHIRWLAPAV
jgi:hypothetical protein